MKKSFLFISILFFISYIIFSGNFIDKRRNSLREFKTAKELTKLLKEYAKNFPELDSKKIYFFILEKTKSVIKKLGKRPERFDFIFEENSRFYSEINEVLISKELNERKPKTGLSFFIVGYNIKKNRVYKIVDLYNKLIYLNRIRRKRN